MYTILNRVPTCLLIHHFRCKHFSQLQVHHKPFNESYWWSLVVINVVMLSEHCEKSKKPTNSNMASCIVHLRSAMQIRKSLRCSSLHGWTCANHRIKGMILGFFRGARSCVNLQNGLVAADTRTRSTNRECSRRRRSRGATAVPV